ncbi:hypothetical protein GGTG_08918 [Gaeumannomyces tritici R3-111a-1]|uniref:Uncharacterized protein n=1 Tax=Gaeumannomyces tritici (strain R3-111a-1) TaxID=644352 RepID=J3P5X8_GAET3|nr:hypothetical protein GGTG_08918 [Gaeumannomyces tritici R3-111a-1]EJT75080.1 hypothetical protein GGTG_08918 [Gaeumannomyces tritici R3-111a-1]
MCYFDQTKWVCGYWKWGNFRQQCTKEYRTGETCGLKLVYETFHQASTCRLCEQLEKKQRRYNKMAADVERWSREGGRPATIEKTQQDMYEISQQMNAIYLEHQARERMLS